MSEIHRVRIHHFSEMREAVRRLLKNSFHFDAYLIKSDSDRHFIQLSDANEIAIQYSK